MQRALDKNKNKKLSSQQIKQTHTKNQQRKKLMGESKPTVDRIKNNLHKLFVIRYSLSLIPYTPIPNNNINR